MAPGDHMASSCRRCHNYWPVMLSVLLLQRRCRQHPSLSLQLMTSVYGRCCVSVRGLVGVDTGKDQRLVVCVFLNCPWLCPFRPGLLLNLPLMELAWQTGQWASDLPVCTQAGRHCLLFTQAFVFQSWPLYRVQLCWSKLGDHRESLKGSVLVSAQLVLLFLLAASEGRHC